MSSLEINQAALSAFLNDEHGPVAAELLSCAEGFVEDSREAIGVDRPKPWRSGRSLGKNPLKQTGLLQRSITTDGPRIENSGRHAGNLVVEVISDGSAFRRDWDYAKILLEGGRNGNTAYGPYVFSSKAVQNKLTFEE